MLKRPGFDFFSFLKFSFHNVISTDSDVNMDGINLAS